MPSEDKRREQLRRAQAKRRKKKVDQGLKAYEIWVYPDDWPEIRQILEKFKKEREEKNGDKTARNSI